MNRPVRRVAVACLVLFGLLLLNANYRQVVKGPSYRDNDRNSRVLVRNYEHERGQIALAGPGRPVVARSSKTDGRYTYLRSYPQGPLFAHTTGYDSIIYGLTGVEAAENQVLSGEDPRLFVNKLSEQLTGKAPSGGAVVLTLQQAAQQAAVDGLAGRPGAVVALDPRTGAVLALASAPTFDPTKLSSFDFPAIRSYFGTLTKDPGRPLVDRATAQTYPPGSTFKLIDAAAALQNGRSPDTRIPSPDQLKIPQTSQPLRNYAGESCTGMTSTLADALRVSCNTAFAQLGLDLGEQALRDQAAAFGFGDDSLRLAGPVAASQIPAGLDPPSLAQSAIGQRDVRVTPLQMAMVAAGIANGGRVMTPYDVAEVDAPDLSTLDLAQPSVYKQAVPKEVADQLTAMMEGVVSNGTGTNAQIPNVRVAGKTGTAQNAPGKQPHAWFIGFAPAQDPKVAVAVLVENGGVGGSTAAPIAKSIMQAVLGG